jgi:hypothetical protein
VVCQLIVEKLSVVEVVVVEVEEEAEVAAEAVEVVAVEEDDNNKKYNIIGQNKNVKSIKDVGKQQCFYFH